MSKRKDLLLTESVTARMMGLAGIGALTKDFLRESPEDSKYEGMDSSYEEEEEEDEGEEEELFQYGGEEEELDEADGETCESCGMKEGKHKSSCKHKKLDENFSKRVSRLKRLLEQVEDEAPAPEAPAPETPPAMEGGGDALEEKVKDFVRKLGDLVQETLGVEVSVEEGEEPEEMPAPESGGAEPPMPEPMAEALNKLVNKVAHRVKLRLEEAKKKEDASKLKKLKMMKEKKMALKKKEEEAKKKEAEKKKAAAKKK